MGARTARNLMAGGFLDLVELSQKFSMAEIEVPAAWDGKTLRQLDLRKRALNMIAKKSGEEVIMQLDPDVPLKLGEKYIIVGTNEMLETLSARR